jgi:alanine-synthesizing transaminase
VTFSSRVRWGSETNEITRLAAAMRERGETLLDLTESNPTRAGIEYPEAAIVDAFRDPGLLSYEPASAGMWRAREAVAEHVGSTPERVFLTASTSEAYCYLFKLLTEPGDQVLVPRPSYPLFEHLAAMEKIEVRQYPLRWDHGWFIDAVALEAAVTARTRAVLTVNPNNPTGSYLKRGELATIERLGLPVIADEVFRAYSLTESVDRARVQDAAVLSFTLGGLSKECGLPQMKLGWIEVNGPERAQAIEGLEWIADTYLSVGAPVQSAVKALLEAGGVVRERILDRVRGNLARLMACGVELLQPEGGWYATVRVPRTRSEEEWMALLLREHRVLVQPGYFFDFEAEAYLVVSLLTEPGVFAQGIRRLLVAVNEVH